MKKAWSDIKSFFTVAAVILLFIIVMGNMFGFKIDETILVLVTNVITAILTYYFNKKDENTENAEK